MSPQPREVSDTSRGGRAMMRTHLYVGCYTHRSTTGIHLYDASDPAAAIEKIGEFGGVEHPSFLAAHPHRNVLYAVSETVGHADDGLVALAIDPADGTLTQVARASSHGDAPCHVSVSPDGTHLAVANYVGGTVAAYALRHDGTFGELIAVHRHEGSGPTARQEGPHAHSVTPGPDGRFVYAADLGTDRVERYRHDVHGDSAVLELDGDTTFEPGSGPRHLAFHPSGTTAFVLCELDSTIVAVDVDPASGVLTPRETHSTLPTDFDGTSIAAEVRVHPNGEYVYTSNRGHDSIAVFEWRGTSRHLEPLGHVPSGGRTPRNFALHPSGDTLLVANQDSDTLVSFELDAGMPRQQATTTEVSEPVCVAFRQVAP